MTKYEHVRIFDFLQFTLAYRYTEDTLLIGVAKCSKKDTFKRSEGRKIAEQRLNEKPISIRINKFSGVRGTLDNFINKMAERSIELMITREYSYDSIYNYFVDGNTRRKERVTEESHM